MPICWRYQRFCKAFILVIFADSSKGVCPVISLQHRYFYIGVKFIQIFTSRPFGSAKTHVVTSESILVNPDRDCKAKNHTITLWKFLSKKKEHLTITTMWYYKIHKSHGKLLFIFTKLKILTAIFVSLVKPSKKNPYLLAVI